MRPVKLSDVQFIWFGMAVLMLMTACKTNVSKQKNQTEKMSEMIRYNHEGKPFIRINYSYNDNSQMELESIWDSSGAGTFNREKKYFYEDSLLVKTEFYGIGGLEYETRFTYDDKNRNIREESLDTDVYMWRNITYDDNDNIILEENYDLNNGITKVSYSYNKVNNLDTAISYDQNGQINRKNYYIYQQDTLLTELLFLSPDNEITHHWKYEYNANGKRVLEKEITPNGTEFILKKYEYNEAGKLTIETATKYRFYTRNWIYGGNGKLLEEREFSRIGNLTSVIRYE